MREMIARCGFKCYVCLAFKGINKTPEDQEEAARAWRTYYGLDIPVAEIPRSGATAVFRRTVEATVFPSQTVISPPACRKGAWTTAPPVPLIHARGLKRG